MALYQRCISFFYLASLILFLSGCTDSSPHVVIYTSLDRHLAEPVLLQFEKDTGIAIKTVYDTEANKTTGLVNRLIAEKDNPQCDVFWNSEIGRTLMLKQKGILAPYQSPNALNRDKKHRGPESYWTGLAARARVIIVNTKRVAKDDYPTGLADFTLKKWKGQTAIGNPHFGTTGTHFTALYNAWGVEQFKQWLSDLYNNKVALLPGNAQVKNKVASGEYAFGLTDTDDALAAIEEGAPVDIVFPDQATLGTFFIPNSVALIKNSPHKEQAKKLIDYLLSTKTEMLLAQGPGGQIPVQKNVPGPAKLPNTQQLKSMPVHFEQLGTHFETMLKIFNESWPH